MSQQLGLDFKGVAVTLNEMKQCARDIKLCFGKYNSAVPIGKAEINECIFDCLESTLSSWTTKIVRESNMLNDFLERQFNYTQLEIKSHNEVRIHQ